MAIRIVSAAATHLYSVNSKINKKDKNGDSTIASRKESVEISDEAKEASKQVDKLKDIINKQPDIRIPLVEELEAKIKSNDYPIEQNLNEIVRRLIRGSGYHEVA